MGELTIGTYYSIYAQPNYNSTDQRTDAYRFSFWFEGNFNGTIKKNKEGKALLQYQLDYQYRRQADANYIAGGNTTNPFQNMFQMVFRPWIHYWIKPGVVRFSTSPLGYWSTWSPASEGTIKYNPELRFSNQVTINQKIGKLELQQRYRYEFRFIGSSKDAETGINDLFRSYDHPYTGHKMRFRYMFKLSYALNRERPSEKGAYYLTAWDELFLGVGKNTTDTKIFDQNRLIGLVGHTFNTAYPIRVALGMTWQYAPKYNYNVPPTQTSSTLSYNYLNWESNRCIQLYIIFDEFLNFRAGKKALEKSMQEK